MSVITLSTPNNSITVQSGLAANTGTGLGTPLPTNATFKVDWQGSAPVLGKPADEEWLVDYLGVRPAAKSLAELTGLVVKLEGVTS
ncbi:hypothetical protein [Propionivibrio sp.]|uniref:hypothetical protein n=1 Tax=Propionivibrio sp. TaxID=2212460 RepID=UPI00261958B7|nr:hypothetical protein [Propionivibrio sp.]